MTSSAKVSTILIATAVLALGLLVLSEAERSEPRQVEGASESDRQGPPHGGPVLRAHNGLGKHRADEPGPSQAPVQPASQAESALGDRLALALRARAALPAEVTARLDVQRAGGEKERFEGALLDTDTVWFELGSAAQRRAPDDVLRVTVRAPGFLPAERALGWSELTSEPPGDGGRIWRAAIGLTATVSCTGHVLDASGRPVHGAFVYAYAALGRRANRRPFAAARTDAQGGFRIGVAPRAVTVLLADGEPHAPGVLRLSTRDAGNDLQPVEIRMARGHRLAGRVRWDGDAPAASGWSVWYEIEAPADGVLLQAGSRGWWLEQDRAHRAWGETTADAKGAFAVAGLSRSAYHLQPEFSGEAPGRLAGSGPTVPVDDGTTERARRRAIPPDDAVLLDVRPAWLKLAVRADGARPREVRVVVESEQSGWGDTFEGAWQDLALPLAPEVSYRVEVRAAGREPAIHEAQMPGPGETIRLELELEPQRVRAPVTLSFVAPKPIGATAFEFRPILPDGALDKARSVRHEVIEPRRGNYPVELLPGRWRVHCQPGRTGSGQQPRTWFTVKQEIDVPQGGALSVDLTVRQGTTLRIRATSAHGVPLSARVRLFDSGGVARSVVLTAPTEQGWWTSHGDRLGPAGIGWTSEPLPPGHYRIELDAEGYVTWRDTLRLDAQRGAAVVDAVLKSTR